jgi:malonyl-CoA O-methyltransferase
MVHHEFTKRASTYQEYNMIQKQVAQELIKQIPTHPSTLLELGSGSGTIYNLIDWDIKRFVGIDFAKGMSDFHPSHQTIELITSDFDTFDYSQFDTNEFDAVISSSSLQWSKDFGSLLTQLKRIASKHYFAIFTSNTFDGIFEFLNINSPLQSQDYYETLLSEYRITTLHYQLNFNTRKELFEYIKKSGVSGGEKRISYQDAKRLYSNYPHLHLNFEIILAIKD